MSALWRFGSIPSSIMSFAALAKRSAHMAKQPGGPPMTLGNMRDLGVQRLVASCLNDACRHVALIDVWSYPAETEIPYFRSRVVCAKCGK
jgi:hypothetical protein